MDGKHGNTIRTLQPDDLGMMWATRTLSSGGTAEE